MLWVYVTFSLLFKIRSMENNNLLTYTTYNNDNNQDELIINYNLLKNIVYESCTAYDKVFHPVTHF